MKILIIVLTALILLLMITLSLRMILEYDLLENMGYIKIKLFGFITIFNSSIVLVGDQLNLNRKRGKVIVIKIDFKDEKIKYVEDILKNIFNKITIIKLYCFALVCQTNPCLASYMGAIINIFISILYSQMLLKSNDIKLNKKISTGFRQDELKFKIDTKFIFSLYDVLWSITKATKTRIRRDYEKESELQQDRGTI